MAGKSPQPNHEPPFQAPITLMKQWKEEIGDGRGEDAKTTTPQTATQMLNEEFEDPNCVQSYHMPCEPALMGLTTGRLLSSWAT